MKKAKVVLGIGILGLMLLSFKAIHHCDLQKNKENDTALNAHFKHLFQEGIQMNEVAANLSANDIQVIELEEEIDLGFNAADYLPVGFDANQNRDTSLEANKYDADTLLSATEIQNLFAEGIRMENETAGLNASEIHVIEMEDDIEFNSKASDTIIGIIVISEICSNSLTDNQITIEDFDLDLKDIPFIMNLPLRSSERIISADEIQLIEVEENWELDFDTSKFLPKNFNAYAE